MSGNIDALIANFPSTLQENALRQSQMDLARQRYAQNALNLQQQAGFQNALRDVFGNQGSIDPATGLPRPAALAPLMQYPQGLDYAETAAKLGEYKQRAGIYNMRANEYWTDIFHRNVVDPILKRMQGSDPTHPGLPPGMPEEQKQQTIAGWQRELIKDTVSQYGPPDSIVSRWENVPPADPSWAVGSEAWQRYQGQRAKAWHEATELNPATGKQTRYTWNDFDPPGTFFGADRLSPYKPSGVVESGKVSAGKMMYVQNPDGTTTPEMVLQRGNAFTNQAGQPVNVVGEVPASSPDYAGPQPKATGDTTLTGDAYLDKLPLQEKQMVKGVAEGRIAVPSWAMRDPKWKQIIADTAQYDPSFDMTNFNRRNKAYQEFTTGPDGRNIRSINTALNHAAELWHSMDDLAAHEWWKGQGGPVVNWVNQKLKQNIDPALKGALNRFKVNADALGSELERATRGDRTAEQGVQEWRSAFSRYDTPEALQESIKEAWKLLAGRVDSMQEGFKKAIGPRAEVTDLFTPFAKDTYRAFEEGKAPPDITGLVGGATGAGAGIRGTEPTPSNHATLDAAKNAIPQNDTRWYPINTPQGGRQWWRRTPSGTLESGGTGAQPVPGGQ